MKRYARWIYGYWKRHLALLPLLGLLTLLSTAVLLAWPLVWMFAIDTLRDIADVPGDAGRGRILDVIGILLLVGVGRSLRNLYPMLRARANGLLEMAVRHDYFRHVIGKSHRFFQEFRTGDIVTRLTDDISGFPKIAWFMCSGIFRAVESGVGLVFCIAAMILVDWRLGLIALAPLPMTMALWYRVRSRMGQRFDANQKAISQTNDLLESCYSGIRIVKAYNAEDRFNGKARDLLAQRIEVEMGVVRMWALLDSLYMGVANLGRVLTLGFGAFWVLDGSLTPGAIYAIYLYVDQLARPMMDLPQFFIAGKQTAVCIDRLDAMKNFEAGVPADAAGEAPVERIDHIEMTGVSFRFDDKSGRDALSDVSLTLPRGKKIAVVGPVGAGKSTIARVLAGELRPTSGRVLINGRPLRELDLSSYRRHVGYIPQESLLFSDTVRENVAFGRNFGDREVRGALALAQMDDEVGSFPKGLDELLGQRGVRVSGGQRQRLAIARGMAGVPDLLIMDDVTAALDSENEESLWDDLANRHAELTAVIVTHRIATARRADSILVLDRGRVVDRGTHDELIDRCPLYRRLADKDE